MLTSLVSFVTRKCQKIRKINENSQYWLRKSSYLLNDLRNFNEIFRKDVTYDNIKSHKKPVLHPLSRRFFLENYRGVKLPPPLHPPKGLKATRWPRQLILTIANQGHLGITRMKSLFREEVDKVCIRTNRTLRLIS